MIRSVRTQHEPGGVQEAGHVGRSKKSHHLVKVHGAIAARWQPGGGSLQDVLVQHALQELAQPVALRVAQHLARRPVLGDQALSKKIVRC